MSMVYYGLSLNSGSLAGDFYLNFFLTGLVEFPAYTLCLVLLDRTGRKKLHCACMVLGGLACISTIFTVLYLEKRKKTVDIFDKEILMEILNFSCCNFFIIQLFVFYKIYFVLQNNI